jgi:sugar lactone lactonase YvrE
MRYSMLRIKLMRRGAVYYVSPEGKISRLIDNMAFPNGIALSPDEKTLYIGETSRNAVWRVGLEEPGAITVRGARIMAYLNGGAGPDGLAVDEKGNVYVAYFDAGEVVVLTPRGRSSARSNCRRGQGRRPPTWPLAARMRRLSTSRRPRRTSSIG